MRKFLNHHDYKEGEADQGQLDSEAKSMKTDRTEQLATSTNLRRNSYYLEEYIADLMTDELEEHVSAATDSLEAWEFLAKSHAYAWLIGKIKAALVLTETQGSRMEHIADEIMKGLRAVTRGDGSDGGLWSGSFEMIAWNLPRFIQEEYTWETNLKLSLVITITGSSNEAQALSCAEYMQQVWPATGYDTLKALEEAIEKGEGNTHKCKFFRLIVHQRGYVNREELNFLGESTSILWC